MIEFSSNNANRRLVGWLCASDDSSVASDDSSVATDDSSRAFQMHRGFDMSTEIVSYDVFVTRVSM